MMEVKGDEEMLRTRFYSPLQTERLNAEHLLPTLLEGDYVIQEIGDPTTAADNVEQIAQMFPQLFGQKYVQFTSADQEGIPGPSGRPLRVGVVLSGGQAPGGHNVIAGLYDFIKRCDPQSVLLGFLDGPHGIFTGNYRELDGDYIDMFRNQGGFDMIGSGRHKIESKEQFRTSLENCRDMDLDGVVVIGGDDSNTNAALLAEYFKANGLEKCSVVGCPKTIDGDLRNDVVETSFGFDTAIKTYSELIGNIMLDCVSSQKYWHFIRLMGREASNITLECALQTRPNFTLISEEVRSTGMTLKTVVDSLCDAIVDRASIGKNYGIVLIPEGLVEFLDDVHHLISRLNDLLAEGVNPEDVAHRLEGDTLESFLSLPESIRNQMMAERDSHGNVQVSKIETEHLLVGLCKVELQKREAANVNFSPQTHFFGYEGRSGLPSNFDCNYCYTLGYTAGALIDAKMTGRMAVARDLLKKQYEWSVGGAPVTMMMNMEKRKGKLKGVIRKALVELDGPVFQAFNSIREDLILEDLYRIPGPLQFSGQCAHTTNFTLRKGRHARHDALEDEKFPESFLVRDRRDRAPILSKNLNRYVSVSLMRDGCFRLERGEENEEKHEPIRVGVVFCGRQSPGGHNILVGLFEALRDWHPESELIGFKRGTVGFMNGESVVFEHPQQLREFRNIGGFHALGRSVDKLRDEIHLEKSMQQCKEYQLNGLVLIGGPITHSDALRVSQYFETNHFMTKVIGVPCTVNNDMDSRYIGACLGFDTTCKVISQLIGNYSIDCNSAKKYWFFLRVCGRLHGHVALQCGLETRPNILLLGEEISADSMTLNGVVNRICDVICERAEMGKNYGVVLLPESLPYFIPELQILISEINDLCASGIRNSEEIMEKLSSWNHAFLKSLPVRIRSEFLLERTSSGQAQVSQIESENLLIALVEKELSSRKERGHYNKKFSPIGHFLGYQARSAMPSAFDCNLGFNLGACAGYLIANGIGECMVSIAGLSEKETFDWKAIGVPLTQVVADSQRDDLRHSGVGVPLTGKSFEMYRNQREEWVINDPVRNPGPVQYGYADWDKCVPGIVLEKAFSGGSVETKLQEIDELIDHLKSQTDSLEFSNQMADITIIQLQSLLRTLQALQ